MKQIYFILIAAILFSSLSVSAQNLVPNGDLETIKGCSGASSGGYPDILDSAASWIRPTFGSADYLNGCTLSVPASMIGHQTAHSGVGYAGIYIWIDAASTIPNYREYMEVPLTTTLVAGRQYHFQMYVSLAESYYSYTTSSLGAYFSDTLIYDFSTQNNLPFTPQITNTTGPITDTTNWVLVQGDFVAAGGEQYLLIGNFKSYANSDSVLLRTGSPYQSTYIFVDDVSLTTNTTGIDNSVTGMDKIQLYPNPSNGLFSFDLQSPLTDAEIRITDLTGRTVHSQKLSGSGNRSIDISFLENGLYLYQVAAQGHLLTQGKCTITK